MSAVRTKYEPRYLGCYEFFASFGNLWFLPLILTRMRVQDPTGAGRCEPNLLTMGARQVEGVTTVECCESGEFLLKFKPDV